MMKAAIAMPACTQVIMDPATGRSRGYGFVRFGSEEDRDRALKEMNGVFISTRPVRVSLATSKKPGEMGGAGGSSAPRPAGGSGGAGEYIATGDDPNNTTIFLGNLSPYVTEELLRSTFARFGEIVYTKIPPGKGCGFVQFTDRRTAEYAMSEMQGQYVGSSPVRISWGKTSTKTPGAGAAGTAGRPAAAVGAYPGYGGYDASAYQYGAYDPYGMAYSGYGDPYAVSCT